MAAECTAHTHMAESECILNLHELPRHKVAVLYVGPPRQSYQYRKRWLEMYSGSEIAPGFFAWVIPSGNDSCRIGLWSTADRLDGKSIEECYHNLLNHPLWKDRFSNIRETARYCGPVPSGMVRKAYKNRVLLIGDAAGMAKPTTGGGIGPGFEQINGIVDNLSNAIAQNTLSEEKLKSILPPQKLNFSYP